MKIEVDGKTYAMPLFETLTYRELELIEVATGLSVDQFDAPGKQMRVALALAFIAKRRAEGNSVTIDDLLDLPIGKVIMIEEVSDKEDAEMEAEPIPLAHPAPATPEPALPAKPATGNGGKSESGRGQRGRRDTPKSSLV